MSKSNYLEAAILNWRRGTAMPTAPTTLYFCLSTANPGEAGAGVAEPSGGAGYARQALTLAAPVQGGDEATSASSADVTFGPASSSWGTITHAFISDSGTIGAGNILDFGALTAAQIINAGGTLRFPAGSITVGES